MPHVAVTDVSIVRRGHTIVDSISFSLPDRGLTLLGGENGAGKTTLILALAGLRPQTSGSIVVAGRDAPLGRRNPAGGVTYLPQTPSCPRSFTVLDLLYYSAWLQRVPPADRAATATSCLEQVQLVDRGTSRVAKLSGGEQRRAFLASAMVGNSALLLLDEPTVGLDAGQRVGIRRILRQMAADRAVVVSSHIAEDFEHLADRILVLDRGRIAFDGTRDEFFTRASEHPDDMSPAEASFTAIVADEDPA